MAPALHALPFPHGCRGPVGTNGVKSPAQGRPEVPLAQQPWKEVKAFPPVLCLEPPGQEQAMFSVSKQRTFSKA